MIRYNSSIVVLEGEGAGRNVSCITGNTVNVAEQCVVLCGVLVSRRLTRHRSSSGSACCVV